MFALADDRQDPSDDLDARIARAKAAAEGTRPTPNAAAEGYAKGSRVLAELVGAPLGGGLIGWGMDYVLGTKPIAFLILLALSVVVAFRNIYRMAKERAQ